MKKYSIIVLSLLILLFLSNSLQAKEVYNKINAFSIDGVITDATLNYVKNNIEISQKENAAVLIYINTPGGVLEATRNIVQEILSSQVPVITYVYPKGARAASAGMFITIAGDYAIMSQSSNIGAAHPVAADGKDIEGDMETKVLNDTIALSKSIAEKRGRNIEVVVKMVKDSASYTASEALNLKIIDNVAEGENILHLLPESLNISKDAYINVLEPNFTQSLYNIIADPNVLAILLFIGISLLFLEFKAPGTFLFGSFGIVFLVIFGFGSSILPINFLGIGLIAAGFLLFIAEIFITSFGLLTLGGIISFIFGLRALFEHEKSAGISVSMWVIILIVGFFAAVALIIGRLIIKDFKSKPVVGAESMAGLDAEVIEWNSQKEKGKVMVQGEIWNACSKENFKEGDKVKVVRVQGLTLHIEKYNE